VFLQQRTRAWTQDDQSWLGSAYGTDETRSITLDVSAFTQATHYPNGYFPSGLAVSLLGNGLYGPAATGATDFGFLYTAVEAPVNNSQGDIAGDIDVVAPLLDHGRVIVSRLPVAVTGQSLTNPHFIFV
jgi:hypothetical protein